jgi:hypothetical protein
MPRLALILFQMLAADPHQPATEMFTGMAAALSESNPAAFMKNIDPAMPEYEQLRARVTALMAQAEVVSSIDFLIDEGDDTRRTVEVDWLLQIRPVADFGALERRRQVVKCSLERRGKKWLVTALAPVAFFGP